MYNLLLSLGAGFVVALAIRLLGFGWIAMLIPGVLAFLFAYFALNMRMQKRLMAVLESAMAEVQARRFDRGIQLAKGAFVLNRWIFGAESAASALIGQIYWLKGDVEGALPFLERAPTAQWPARLMLAIAHWRKRDLASMERILEGAVSGRSNRKQGLLWCAYAWLLEKEGRHDDAVKVLGRALSANPSDDKVKTALQSVQNGKKLKVGKLYMEWYNFGLETPPQEMPPGFRPGRRATYR